MTAAVRDLDRARAAELARSGDHEGALRVLAGLGRTDVSTLDLLARVHAQRGDFASAQAAWSAVLELEPGHRDAIAGITLVTEITEGKRRARPVPVVLVGGVVVVVAVAVLAVLTWPRQPEPVALPPDPVPVTQSVAPAPPDPRSALMAALAGPDVRLASVADGVQVVFPRGMFLPDSTSLSADGRQQLERWGQVLRGKNVRVTVLGHGLAVPGGPTSGGSATAVERAAAAVEVLSEASGLPATAFTVRSADQSEAPHTGDPALNRTVSLVVANG